MNAIRFDDLQFDPRPQAASPAWSSVAEGHAGPVIRVRRVVHRPHNDLSWIPVTLFALAGLAAVFVLTQRLAERNGRPRRPRTVVESVESPPTPRRASGVAELPAATEAAGKPRSTRQHGDGGDFRPERLLAMCRAPLDGKAGLTTLDELPVEFLGMWWMFAKRGAAGGVELVPDELRRFASFLITAKAWQVANPGVAMAPREFRMIGRLADVDGLPTYLLILGDDMHWIIHGPVAGRWVLVRGFSELNREQDRQVFELMKP